MRNKISVMVLGLLALVFVCGATGGCGGESFVDSTSYQYPNWTPEGLIYCQKAVTHYRKYWGAIGGEYSENRGTDYYYVTMSTEGTNETTLPYTSYPYFSPLGTYVALISGETISIVRRADNVRAYSFSPTTESISELDWGPDEGKLVYVVSVSGPDELYIINLDGTGRVLISSNYAGDANWRFGDKILFSGGNYGGYAKIMTADANNVNNIVIFENAIGGDITRSSTEAIFRGNTGIEHINVTGSPSVYSTTLIARNDLWNIHLSPDGQKIVASGNNITGEQIWLINTNGSNLTQLK